MAMTTFNGARYLRETIDSVLAQSFEDFEFVIIDDASTDATVSIIQSYQDARIRFEPNTNNIGISRSRNRAIALAHGEYIATTDQDDVSEKDRLRHQVAYLDAHPDTILVSSAVRLWEYGKERKDRMRVFDMSAPLHFALFFGRHNVTYSSLCARVDVLRGHHLTFRPEFHYAEDYELYHRIARVGEMATLSAPLVTYRIHGENNSIKRYEAMSGNGRRFLQQAYSELVQRDFGAEEIERVWRIFVEQKPVSDQEELGIVGDLLMEALAGFERCYGARYDARDSVRELAAEIWWSVLVKSSEPLGLSALQAFSHYPDLRPWQPSFAERARVALSTLARRINLTR